MKKSILRLLAVAAILIVLLSPLLLLVSVKKYSPFVALVWVTSILYFIFFKSRKE